MRLLHNSKGNGSEGEKLVYLCDGENPMLLTQGNLEVQFQIADD